MAVDFATSVAQWVQASKGRTDEVFRAIAADALARVKELTPVRTGYLRANWQASLEDHVLPVDRQESAGETASGLAANLAGTVGGARVGAAVGALSGTPIGSAVGGAIGGAIGGVAGEAAVEGGKGDALETAKIGQVIYILNPVAYARSVEYGRSIKRKDGGTTEIEGKGMVRQTVAELPQIASRVVARFR